MNPFADIRFVTVSVHYADILSITLPYNAPRGQSMLVITHGCDHETQAVCRKHGVECVTTNAMYADNASFNKFLPVELGLDHIGRTGWLGVLDADILLPRIHHPWEKRPGNLYIPRRYIHAKLPMTPEQVPQEKAWRRYEFARHDTLTGHCMIWHADDPALPEKPWFQPDNQWVAGPDAQFSRLWPLKQVVRPPLEVLHLGPVGENWAGRVTPYADGTTHPDAEKHADQFRVLMRNKRGRQNAIGNLDDHSVQAIADSHGYHTAVRRADQREPPQ